MVYVVNIEQKCLLAGRLDIVSPREGSKHLRGLLRPRALAVHWQAHPVEIATIVAQFGPWVKFTVVNELTTNWVPVFPQKLILVPVPN